MRWFQKTNTTEILHVGTFVHCGGKGRPRVRSLGERPKVRSAGFRPTGLSDVWRGYGDSKWEIMPRSIP